MSTKRELYVARRVADASGGSVSPETGQWPDAWITRGGERSPVEVVTATERPPDEQPSGGSAVLREQRRAEREATHATAQDGQPRAWGAHAAGPRGAEGFVTTLVGAEGERIPPPRNTADPVNWVLAAVGQKMAKQYGDAAATVLIVDYDRSAMEDSEIRDLARALRHFECPFREVWIVSDLASREAQRVRQVPFR